MKVEFPESLFERIRAGNVVLCTGVRLAAAAGMPTWEEFLGKLAQHDAVKADRVALEQLLEEGKLLTVAGHLRRHLENDTIVGAINEAYGKSKDPSATHRWLHQMPFHAALSTGYDCLLEHALQDRDEPKVYSYVDGAMLRLKEDLKHYVVKVHGDVQTPEKLVLSAADFKRHIASNEPYRAFLEELFRTHTLLFIGYRSFDPDFMLFMERLVSTFRGAVADHYAILPAASGPEMEELYANYRIRVIPYGLTGDPNAALDGALKSLKEQFHKAGGTAEAVEDHVQWLQSQLSALSVRLDVVAGRGLTLTRAKLQRIDEMARQVTLLSLSAEALCRLGNVRLALGEVPAGIECYNMALEHEPEMACAHLNLHHAMAEVRSFDKALQHLERATELDEGTRLLPNRYQVKAVIGRGSTGTVYSARDTELNNAVTVKVLRASFVREHISPELWLEETAPLIGLEHPNVAKVYDAMVEGGRCILVTESLMGRSLERTVEEDGPLTPERGVEIMNQICAGLAYAHGEGIPHLDVMPSNVFLRDDGSVALMDFRSGRAQRGRVVAVARGSEGFRAPELLAGEGAEAPADIYSLGATLYYMTTGKRPLGRFPRIGEVNPAGRRFDKLVGRAMQAIPGERPDSVDAFAKELAGSGGAVVLPESEKDLAGWLEVLAYEPAHEEAHRVLDALVAEYRGAKDWDSLVALMLGRVEVESDHGARLDALRQVAQVFENEVGDLSKAFTALLAAFKEDSSSLEIRQDLERLAAASGLWNDLVQEYSQLAQGQREPRMACEWWVRIGRIYTEKLNHDDYAVAAFQHALSFDANHSDALSEMAAIVKERGEHKEYAKLLTRMAKCEEDASRRVQLLELLAATYATKLNSNEEAILAYRRVLDMDPGHAAAIAALIDLYRDAEMWGELAELMRSRIPLTEVAEDQARYRHVLADLLFEHLDDKEGGIEQLKALVEANPDDIKALRGLERLYDASDRHDEYLTILNKRIAAANDDAEKVSLYRRLAEESEKQGGALTQAAEYLVKVHELGAAGPETYRSLVRIYWELKDYQSLVKTYGWHIAIAERPEDRAVLYAALGRVHEEHLDNAETATEIFNSLLAIDDKNAIALAGLARLYERQGVWAQAVQMLERLEPLQDDDAAKVPLLLKMGQLLAERLLQPEKAIAKLARAQEIDAKNVATLTLLGRLYVDRGDYERAVRMLHDAALQQKNELERVRLLFEAAELCREKLQDDQRALETYQELLDIDPEHVDAGEHAARLLLDKKSFPAALPVLEMLARKADPKDRKLAFTRHLVLAQAATECGQDDKAEKAFVAAHEINPASVEAALGLAALRFANEDFAGAGKLYQALLVHGREALGDETMVDIYFRLSEVKQAAGDHAKAHDLIERAFELAPHDLRVLQRAIEIYQKKEDWASVLRCKQNMRAELEDADQLLDLEHEIGDLLAEKLDRPEDALERYRHVAEQRPDARLQFKIMDLCVSLKRWEEAVSAIDQMVQEEKDSAHCYRLQNTAAMIYRDELKMPDKAVKRFELALDHDPTNMQAFNFLSELLRSQKEFKHLARAYRRMLQRLPEDWPKAERVALWRDLADIAQNEAKDAREAIIALEMLAKLGHQESDGADRLARLYATAGPDAFDKAVEVNQRLLDRKPLHKDAYKELFRIYQDRGERDKAYCVAAVLSLLKNADDRERALYDEGRPAELRYASSKMSDDALWREHIHHPDQVPVLSEMLAMVAPLFTPMAIREREDIKLKSDEQLQPQDDTRTYARVFRYVCEVLEVSPTELYLKPGRMPLALQAVVEEESPAKVLFMDPTLLDGAERDTIFHFARTLSLMRQEHSVLYLSPTPTVIQALALAALKLTNPEYPVRGDVAVINRLAESFASDLPASLVDALANRYDALVEAASGEQVRQWMRAVELSIDRAGLLLCDDLATAARLASATEPLALEEGLTAKDRTAQLFRYAASESYFAARKRLGLALPA